MTDPSSGGHYAPAIATYFEAQSAALTSSSPPPSSNILCRPRSIRIASVGIIAAYVDILIQAPGSFEFAYANTYGIDVLSQTEAENIDAAFRAPGGCVDLVRACRDAIDEFDPEGRGNQPGTFGPCYAAFVECQNTTGDPAERAGVSLPYPQVSSPL